MGGGAGEQGSADRAGGKGVGAHGPWGGGSEEGRSGLRDSDPSLSQVLRQQIRQFEEALEEEEAW